MPISPTEAPTPLRRALSFWPLVLYGLGVIVGAGIYVAIGTVIQHAGQAAPLSFLLAGVAAGLTGLCYAELAGRYPEAGGGVAFVRHAFGSDALARLVGLATTAAIVIATASIAHGTVFYAQVLLPLPAWLLICLLLGGFCVVAIAGVRESVGLAAAMSAVELAGLLLAAAVGLARAPDFHLPGLIPANAPAWAGMFAGAFTAFFAFIGFETLANLAEEVTDAPRTLSRGILAAIAVSIGLYVLVALASVLGGVEAENPLLALFSGRAALGFALLGTIAVANGILVHLVMLARLFYGMAQKGQLPAWLAEVHPNRQTPIRATLLATALVLITALSLPFAQLLAIVNMLTLGVFAMVDLALWRLHRTGPARGAYFRAPAWVPPAAAAVSLALILADLML